jgi:GntR family transcriptional regulator/MocR family aminotransferase
MELPIELDQASGVPLHRQLYDGLRTAIVEGRVTPGTRLPSTRALAAAFMQDDGFERHLRRMRILYRARRAALLEALRYYVGAGVEVIGDRAGMHLVARLPVGDSRAFAARALQAGVALMSTEAHHLHASVPGEFIFGFAEHDEATMEDGVARLGRLIREVSR